MNPPVANRERVYNYYNLNRLSWKCPECDAVQMHVCVHSGNGICRPLTRLTWPRAGVTYTNAPFPLAAAAIKAAPQASIYLQFDARTRWVNPRRRLLCENYGAADAGDNYTHALAPEWTSKLHPRNNELSPHVKLKLRVEIELFSA